MLQREADFAEWENEMTKERELLVVRESLILAQQLQTHIQTLPRDYQHDAWVEALRLLADEKHDVHGRQHILSISQAFAFFEGLDDEGRPHIATALSYGPMRVIGTTGCYTYSTNSDLPSIMLQVFEPQQLAVTNPIDEMHKRLPVPLSVPVLCVDNIFPYKK